MVLVGNLANLQVYIVLPVEQQAIDVVQPYSPGPSSHFEVLPFTLQNDMVTGQKR